MWKTAGFSTSFFKNNSEPVYLVVFRPLFLSSGQKHGEVGVIMHSDIPYATAPRPKPPTMRQTLEVPLELLYTGGKFPTYVIQSPGVDLWGLALGPDHMGSRAGAVKRPVCFEVPIVKGWKGGTKVTYKDAVPSAGDVLRAPCLGRLPDWRQY
jgi:hypothetical protein